MAGKGFENGKYFEIDRKGKLKEMPASKFKGRSHMPEEGESINDWAEDQAQNYATEKANYRAKQERKLKSSSMKEHEHPYWDSGKSHEKEGRDYKGNKTITYGKDHPYYGERGVEKRMSDNHKEYLRRLKDKD